jgi:hypothetical protein
VNWWLVHAQSRDEAEQLELIAPALPCNSDFVDRLRSGLVHPWERRFTHGECEHPEL